MKKFTTLATICLFGLIISVSQAAEMMSSEGMMKDNMKESMDHQVMKKDDMSDSMEHSMEDEGMSKDNMTMKDDSRDKSDSMK
jgi:hypothetical protein